MSYAIFDPRTDLIAAFTVQRDYDNDGELEQVIVFTGTDGKKHNIPVLLEEVYKAVDNPTIPAIYLSIVSGTSDVSTFGNSRYCRALIDVHLYYTNNTWLNISTFHKTILGTIVDGITSKSKTCAITNCLTAHVVSDVESLLETNGNDIIHHKVLTIEAKNLETG